jgi:hypothetical protein
MGFFKDKLGMILFFFTYLAIFTQLVGIMLTWDYHHDSYLPYHKYFFVLVAIMAVWSHYKASFTNPGLITHNLNPYVIEFYINLHEIPIKRAEKFNQSYGKMLFEKMDEEEKEETKEEEEDNSDYDENEYEPVTSVTDDLMSKISKEYKVELKRCDKCYIVRTPRVHHCSVCKGCVMKMDHHCPWINNCVGQFNQKFFLQFCYYCLIGCSQAAFVTVYYLIYRHKKEYVKYFIQLNLNKNNSFLDF